MAQKAASVVIEKTGNLGDDEYHHYLNKLQARFLANVGSNEVLFQTDANRDDALWAAYLNAFPPRKRLMPIEKLRRCRLDEMFGAPSGSKGHDGR